MGLAQKVCDVAASIPVLGALPKAASQKIASIRSEVASSGPSSIVHLHTGSVVTDCNI
ncbi:hypothetical protein [Paenibacillus sp. S29]|uniref:hypothetical protein n=1 Tax=Paenibacillus sp. S29 TaxID=3394611 RepID=UPI0039BF6FDD